MTREEFLKNNFENQRDWIKHANNTAAILFAFNGAFVFWFATKIQSFIVVSCLMISFTALSILTFIFLLLILIPRLGNFTHSLMHFIGVANYKYDGFREKIKGLNQNGIEDTIIDQIYQNAKVAKGKFFWLRMSVIFTLINIIVASIIVIRF